MAAVAQFLVQHDQVDQRNGSQALPPSTEVEYAGLKAIYMSQAHEIGVILYCVLAPLSEIAFAVYIYILSHSETIDVSVRFLSSQMSLCCLVCTLNQIGFYAFEAALYRGFFEDFHGFTDRLCLAVWSGWSFTGQMILFIGSMMALEIYLIAAHNLAYGEMRFRVMLGMCLAWIFSAMTTLSGVYLATETHYRPLCDPVDQSDPAVRFFVFGCLGALEIVSFIVLRRANAICNKQWRDEPPDLDTEDHNRLVKVHNMVIAFKKPITELFFYNMLQTVLVLLVYNFPKLFAAMLTPKNMVLFNFWAFEFDHAFAGILGINMITATHPELRKIARRLFSSICGTKPKETAEDRRNYYARRRTITGTADSRPRTAEKYWDGQIDIAGPEGVKETVDGVTTVMGNRYRLDRSMTIDNRTDSLDTQF